MLNFDSQLSHRQVGQTLADMPLGSIIEKLAISIAQAQRALDRQAIQMFGELASEKVMLPTPNGGVVERSMLELGFAPSFYHFDSVVIEIKVEIKLHVAEEQRTSFGFDNRSGNKTDTTAQPAPKPVTNSSPVTPAKETTPTTRPVVTPEPSAKQPETERLLAAQDKVTNAKTPEEKTKAELELKALQGTSDPPAPTIDPAAAQTGAGSMDDLEEA
jgi:hypothetical protein